MKPMLKSLERNGSYLLLFIIFFALNALWKNVDCYSKFFWPTKRKFYFSLFDMEMFIMRLNFLYYICFAFFHLCLKMEFLKNQKCFLYSGLAGMRLPWLEEEDGVSLKPQWSKTMCHLLH